MDNRSMMIALIHWRIRPEPEHIAGFLEHWNTTNRIADRAGLVAEFLSDSLPIAAFPYITWHLDPDSLGDHKSYVTVGLWRDAADFSEQIAQYFNDDKPLLPFEQYRRRRVVFKPIAWRIGGSALPSDDSPGVA